MKTDLGIDRHFLDADDLERITTIVNEELSAVLTRINSSMIDNLLPLVTRLEKIEEIIKRNGLNWQQ